MLKFIRSFFSSKSQKQSKDEAPARKDLENLFLARLRSSTFIKPEAIEIALKHLTHKINLNKTTNKLTADEKKALGINTRLSITKDLVDILTPEGISQADPQVNLGDYLLQSDL